MSPNAVIFNVVFSVVNLLYVLLGFAVYCVFLALILPIPLLMPDYSVLTIC